MGPLNLRRRLMLGVPVALILAGATYLILHRGSATTSASAAPSAPATQRPAPKESPVKAK
jgi:hypothetical protein